MTTPSLTQSGPLTYEDVRSFLAQGLADLEDPLTPVFTPGPASNAQLQKLSPQSIVFITVGAGAGLSTEQLFDRPFIAIRTIGQQNDYGSAETLALAVDLLLVRVAGNATVGATNALYITRTGGRPQLLDYDSANRYHFSCSYIIEAESGL